MPLKDKDLERKYQKAYRENNRERLIEQSRVWREANAVDLKARKKAYYDRDKEKIKAHARAFREANKDRINAHRRSPEERKKINAYRRAVYVPNPKAVNQYPAREDAFEVNGDTATMRIGDCNVLLDAEIAFDFDPKYWYVKRYKGVPYFNSTVTFDGKTRRTSLHRVIALCPKGMEVDHKNGNTLDNRRANLRICTRNQNAKNRKKSANNTSGFKGVNFDPSCRNHLKPWRAAVVSNGKRHYIGRFETREDAAKAYDAAVIRLHGEFARPNSVTT